MYVSTHKITHTLCLIIVLLAHCHPAKGQPSDSDLELEVSRFTRPTIKQMIEILEDSITDLADTVTLQANRIDARLAQIEDKLDLLLTIVEHQ